MYSATLGFSQSSAPSGGDTSAAASSAATALAGSQVKNETYQIAVDDVLDVYVVDIAEITRSYRVTPDGTISVPLLTTPMPAAGRTLPELSDAIREALRAKGVVMNAQVTVSVQQSRLHGVSITGAVKHPQIYTVLGRTTILDVISQAEGLADDAGSIGIVRRGDIAARALNINPDDDMAMTVTVDIRDVMEAGDRSANIAIYPGDHVTIPRAGVVYVVGAFNKPGGYPIRTGRFGMTVMQAVALAGDMKSTARPDQGMIVRFDVNSPGGRTQIPVNLKKVLAGKNQDVALRSEDILFVPDSISKRTMRAAIQLAAGMAVLGRY
jgi:polysaccharide export outer membrane protein